MRSTMAIDYLHNHPDFADLIRVVGEERTIATALRAFKTNGATYRRRFSQILKEIYT